MSRNLTLGVIFLFSFSTAMALEESCSNKVRQEIQAKRVTMGLSGDETPYMMMKSYGKYQGKIDLDTVQVPVGSRIKQIEIAIGGKGISFPYMGTFEQFPADARGSAVYITDGKSVCDILDIEIHLDLQTRD